MRNINVPEEQEPDADADEPDEPDKVLKNTKPIAVEALIGQVQYKYLPDRLRQMILAELVYCTDPATRVYPGCTANMDASVGRWEAFWLALCRCVLINVSGSPHSDIVRRIPPSDDMDTHVPLLKKRDMLTCKCDVDLVADFAKDLGDFDGREHKAIRAAIGIGGKAPFVPPVEMAMESMTEKAKADKAMEMMLLPFRLPDLAISLGVTNAEKAKAAEEPAKGGDECFEEDGYPCVMEVGDTLDTKYMKSVKKELAKVRAEYAAEEKEFRTIVVTSPPWGTLDDGRSGSGCEDEALSTEQIRVVAVNLADILEETAVVCIHLPILTMGIWRGIFESTAKWVAYMSPVHVTPSTTKGLTFLNKYQLATNVTNFLCFHRADVHPTVTADFLRNKKSMVKMMHSLWNAGQIIPSANVPKIERVTTKISKQTTYVRTQQLSTAVLRPLIRMFGRAMYEQPQPIVIDPFMGTGSTGVAAHQLGCSFMGWDRDQVVVVMANAKFRALVEVYTCTSLTLACTRSIPRPDMTS